MGGGRERLEFVNFFSKNPNLKKEQNFLFALGVGGGGRVIDFFYKESESEKKYFFLGGGGSGRLE